MLFIRIRFTLCHPSYNLPKALEVRTTIRVLTQYNTPFFVFPLEGPNRTRLVLSFLIGRFSKETNRPVPLQSFTVSCPSSTVRERPKHLPPRCVSLDSHRTSPTLTRDWLLVVLLPLNEDVEVSSVKTVVGVLNLRLRRGLGDLFFGQTVTNQTGHSVIRLSGRFGEPEDWVSWNSVIYP